jgi:hypothetical protein
MKTAVKYKKWIFSRFYIGLTQEPTPRIYYKEFINKEICHLNGKIKLL